MQILLFHGHSGPAQCLAHRSFGSARKPCYVGHRHAVDMAQAQYNLLRRRQRAHYGHHALYPLDVGRGITEVGHVGSVYAQRVMMTSQIVDAEVCTSTRASGAMGLRSSAHIAQSFSMASCTRSSAQSVPPSHRAAIAVSAGLRLRASFSNSSAVI